MRETSHNLIYFQFSPSWSHRKGFQPGQSLFVFGWLVCLTHELSQRFWKNSIHYWLFFAYFITTLFVEQVWLHRICKLGGGKKLSRHWTTYRKHGLQLQTIVKLENWPRAINGWHHKQHLSSPWGSSGQSYELVYQI